jgi:SAM-dependent methyltransferase
VDATAFNRTAWNNIATSSKRWFSPCEPQEIQAARRGKLRIRLTACKPIPADWLGDVAGQRVLLLGGGGGHQGPLLAAARAEVTVVDLSEKQLAIDREIAASHDLDLKTVHADMADLVSLADDSFDLVINPCSVNFVPDARPVWQEAARVLQPGGALIAGLMQPVNFLFDAVERDRGKLMARFRIPYSDLDLPAEERARTLGPERPIDFGHSLSDLVGGQLEAGLLLTHMMEDRWGGDDVLSDHIATFLATRAIKNPNQQ